MYDLGWMEYMHYIHMYITHMTASRIYIDSEGP